MANVTANINGKAVSINDLFDLVEKKINAINTANTVDELNKLLADVKIGIDAMGKATCGSGVICRTAVQVMIDALKDELNNTSKKIEEKVKTILTAEAKVDIAQLLVQAKKWLGYGYKDVASSYLRAYERLRSKFGIDADPEYESVKLAACA